MLFKKTLVLGSSTGGNEKAVVSFEKQNGDTMGQVKLYNFRDEPNGILSLGLKEGERVVKIGLTRLGNFKYSFSTQTPLELSNFTVAVVNIYQGEAKPILHGSTLNAKVTEEFLAQATMEMEQVETMQQAKQVLDNNHIELADQDQVETLIDSECSKNCEAEKCSACKYRYAFFSGENQSIDQDQNFYESISEDIDKLFASHTEEEFLSQIIPFSKWVKIENEDSDDYYVLGLIYENDKVKYICYGVPGIYDVAPPESLKGLAEWLPLDSTKEQEYGYWITYQDAENGENVKATFTVV